MRRATGPEAVTEQVTAGFARAADRYDETGTGFFAEMGARLVDQAGVGPGMRVLDVGCGKGAATIPAAHGVGPAGTVTGIDLAAPMLDQARARARAAGLDQVRFERADAGNPPYPPQSSDVVLAGYVIQFLPRPDLAVQRWLALLRPGGTLGFSWGLAQDPAWIPVMAAVDAYVPAGVPGFETFFRRPPFTGIDPAEQMLTGCGYRQVDTVTYEVETVYASPAQWWAACRSQGPWAISWRHIPASHLLDAQESAFAALEAVRGPDGTFTRTLTLAITTGRRPQAGPG
ncbi:MAG TPA: class I SAM-dependent methyltransferase [Streptosporangiaceae bacterium]